jgi:flagellar hook-length control protein FliK
VKENGGGSFESGNEKEGPDGFSLNFMKNFNGKNISTNESRAMHNSRFSRQMQSIIENAKVVVKDSRNGSFTVKLYPKQLGMVNVNLGLEQGVVNGKFFVENGEARDLLMDNLNLIKEQLEEAGINIGEFEVNVNHQGEMFTRDDTEENFFTLPGTGDEVTKEYHTNSLSLHDGEFNMVI